MKKILETIKILANKSSEAEKADDAMKFAQAALNLSNALSTIVVTERDSGSGELESY